MHDDQQKERGQHAEAEDDQVICSNQLLAAIRERMAKGKTRREEKQIPEPETEQMD